MKKRVDASSYTTSRSTAPALAGKSGSALTASAVFVAATRRLRTDKSVRVIATAIEPSLLRSQ